jgi:hypothetical protein
VEGTLIVVGVVVDNVRFVDVVKGAACLDSVCGNIGPTGVFNNPTTLDIFASVKKEMVNHNGLASLFLYLFLLQFFFVVLGDGSSSSIRFQSMVLYTLTDRVVEKTMQESEFLCTDIYTEFAGEQAEKTTKKIPELDLTITVNVLKHDKEKVNAPKMIQRMIKIVKFIQQFPYSRYTKGEPWSIIVYLSDHKKKYCSDEKTLTPCHVNSGETIFYGSTKIEVRLYRKEDFYKVLIHELLHRYDWDRLVKLKTGTKTWMVNEQEAFIEANARFLYCRVLAKWFPTKTFKEYWRIEMEWMKTQANFLRHARWKTDTNTVAYYLFTLALLNTPNNEFLNWMYTNATKRTTKQMQQQWCNSNRTKWWNLFYHNTTDFWLPVETAPPSCMSLRMVKTQISLQ